MAGSIAPAFRWHLLQKRRMLAAFLAIRAVLAGLRRMALAEFEPEVL